MTRGASYLNAFLFSLAFAAMFVGSSAEAQSRFSPAIRVGDGTITRYQIDQRTLFLSLLRAPGDPRELARDQLISEALQLDAAEAAGITPSPDEISAGLAEFAARADLTAEEFVAALGQNGVGPETFRDFITAGVAWRAHVRARFDEQASDISRSQISRTISQTGTEGGRRVLLSEILLPAGSPETTAASRVRAAELATLNDEAEFAAAARRFSIVPSAPAGGERSWIALDSLPDEVVRAVSGLSTGQISRPIEIEDFIGLYLLRDSEIVAPGAPDALSVDYALFITDGGEAEAARVVRLIDTCDDLYSVAQGLPENRLIRETEPIAALMPDIRAEVASMDAGETSIALTRSGRSTVLMLCDRKPALKSTVDIDIIGNRLLNARLGGLAADYLADLRARTVIEVLIP